MDADAQSDVHEQLLSDGAALRFQLDVLKREIESVDEIIGRIDDITQKTKNWAIVTWTGALGLALTHDELRQYAVLTMVLPLVFWFVDAQWRSLQKRTVYRSRKISEFLNNQKLLESFDQQRIIDFTIFDPVAHSHRKEPGYKEYTSIRKTLFFPEVLAFYFPLAIISAFVGMATIITG